MTDDGQVSGVSSRSLSRTGMRTLVDNLQAESPRPRFIIVLALHVDHDNISWILMTMSNDCQVSPHE